MRKSLKILSVILSAILCFVCFVSCKEQEASIVSITLEKYTEPLSMHNELWQKYLSGDYADIKNEKSENSYPETVVKWNVELNEWYVPVKNAVEIRFGMDPDLNTYESLTQTYYEESKCTLYNLSAGKTYYWKVILRYKARDNNDILISQSEISSFTVKDEIPYNYRIDGVTNVREMGGYPTNDGKTINKGLLFRSGRLDSITTAGAKTFKDILKIKTEIDLRAEYYEDGSSIFGVEYVKCGMHSDTTAKNAGINWKDRTSYLTVNRDAIKQVFKILSKEENYPIDYHCSIGTDRTGVIAFLVETLLDVKSEWVMRDYLLSNYAKIDSYNRIPNDINIYVNFINNNAAGNTLSDKTYNYLKSIGVSASELDSVIRILKG